MDIISDICEGIDNRAKLYINPDRYECIEYAISKLNKKDMLYDVDIYYKEEISWWRGFFLLYYR